MPDADFYFDRIDGLRVLRARELLEIKSSFSNTQFPDPLRIKSKAAIVLVYANWEGFYNECVDVYLDFQQNLQRTVTGVNWLLLVAALTSDFNSLFDRHHSLEAKKAFVGSLQTKIPGTVQDLDRTIVKARSNLDFDKLRGNFELLNLNIGRLQSLRIRIDKELVGWRHGVAHGDSPDLTAMDIVSHINFSSTALLTISDVFQEAILQSV